MGYFVQHCDVLQQRHHMHIHVHITYKTKCAESGGFSWRARVAAMDEGRPTLVDQSPNLTYSRAALPEDELRQANVSLYKHALKIGTRMASSKNMNAGMNSHESDRRNEDALWVVTSDPEKALICAHLCVSLSVHLKRALASASWSRPWLPESPSSLLQSNCYAWCCSHQSGLGQAFAASASLSVTKRQLLRESRRKSFPLGSSVRTRFPLPLLFLETMGESLAHRAW